MVSIRVWVEINKKKYSLKIKISLKSQNFGPESNNLLEISYPNFGYTKN